MRALVTGGAGFIGRYIVEQLLARGDEVRVLGRRRYPELAALGVACFQADLAAQDDVDAALRGCDVVFHVAAKAQAIELDLADFYRNNVTATQHILHRARRAGVAKFVYTSSPSVVIGVEDICGGDESLPYLRHYLAPYPLTKALAERHVLAASDILTVAIRPHLVWGPRDPGIVPALLARARRGRLFRVGSGNNLVDITYVENAASAHLQAADALSAASPLRGRAYFIGQEAPVRLWAFVDTLVQRAGAGRVRGSVNESVALGAAHLLEAAYRTFSLPGEPLLTRLTVNQVARSHWFSHEAARRDFGYHAQITTEEGLERTIASLKEAS